MSRSEKFAGFVATDIVRGDLRQRSVIGALFTAAGGVLDFGVRLVSTLILARLLIPEHFGLIAMVTAVTGIAEQFSSLGLSTATVQAREISHKQCSNLFWINVAGGALFGLAVFGLSSAIATFYEDPRLVAITMAMSANFFWIGLTVQHEALLDRQMKQPQIAGMRFLASFASAAVALILALNNYGYWALVWREILRIFLVAVGVWILCPWMPGLPNRGARIGGLLRFGRDMTLTQILGAIVSRLDSLLIGRFAGPVVLGFYRQAYNLMMAPIEQLNGPIFSVAQPGLSMLQAEPERYRRYYEKILFVVSLATIPLGVFTAIYAAEIVLVVLGKNWIGATVFLQIFGVAGAIRPALGTSGLVLVTSGKSGRFFVVVLVHSVALCLLMAIGVPWGAVGIAVGHVAATVLLTPWKLYYSFAGTPVTAVDFMRGVSKPIIASAAMAVALTVFRAMVPLDGGVVSLLSGCGTAVASYFMFLIFLPGAKGELQSVLEDVVGALRQRSIVV